MSRFSLCNSSLKPLRHACAIAMFSSVTLASQSQNRYHPTIIAPAGNFYTTPNKINASGIIVGDTQVNGAHHAWKWLPSSNNGNAGTYVDLNPPNIPYSRAFGINSIGIVVGQFLDASNRSHAFCTLPGNIINKDTDDIGKTYGVFGYANAINDFSRITGEIQPNGLSATAFRTTSTFLLNPATDSISPAGWTFSGGIAINLQGTTVGTAYQSGGGLKVAFADQSQHLVVPSYGGVPAPGICLDINNANDYVGEYLVGFKTHGFYVPKGMPYAANVRDIGTLGGDYSRAYGINNSGMIVGVSSNGFDQRGFRYNVNTWQMEDLNGLLDTSIGNRVITSATSINDMGQIVGNITDEDGYMATVLLTPSAALHLTEFSPGAMMISASPAIVQIKGTGFGDGTVVLWNGAALSTTYVSDTELTAVVPAAFLNRTRVAKVIAVNPGSVASNNFISVPVGSALKSFSIVPVNGTGGGDWVATLTLRGPVPHDQSITVQLNSDNAAATTYASMTFSEGEMVKSFNVQTRPVATTTKVNFTATVGTEVAKAAITINAPIVTRITISDAYLIGGGASATSYVFLTGIAPAGGMVVHLTSSDPAVTIPASITVPAGNTAVSFEVKPNMVTKKTPVVLTAKIGAIGKTVLFSVNVK